MDHPDGACLSSAAAAGEPNSVIQDPNSLSQQSNNAYDELENEPCTQPLNDDDDNASSLEESMEIDQSKVSQSRY